MLIIRQSQMDKLARSQQEVFIKKMIAHLESFRKVFPGRDLDFGLPGALARLHGEVNLLLENDFHIEADLAAAVELFELFGLDSNHRLTRQIIGDEKLKTSKKLDMLRSLTGKGDLP